MPITTVAVTCTAARPDGSLIAGGKFRFLLSNTDTENGLVVPREISATANASGVAVANLWPNSLGALGTQYRVLLSDLLGSTIDLGSCTVPNSACDLHSILGLGTAPTLDQATVAKLAAQTAAAASSTSATQSASSATQAATSATAAAGSATAAAASQTAATGSVTSAATSATAAGNSATSAASSNTAAGASAISAALSAADALSSKNAAATSATNSASSATSAQTSATNAATSASTATTKASEAATSATNAATSEAAALASKNAAATSETNAQGSATTAATQASNAASSATNAASSATNAASSATAAASSAAAVAAATTGTMSTQNANNVAITGGAVDGTTVGSTTAAAGSFTTLNSSGATRLGGLSGNQSLQVNNVASAVNYLQVVGAVTGGAPTISALGTDTNINAAIVAKGTGSVQLQSSGATVLNVSSSGAGIGDFINIYPTSGFMNWVLAGIDTNIGYVLTTKGGLGFYFSTGGGQQAAISHTASAVNYLNLTGAATGAAPTLSAQGSDANINLNLTPKGVNGAVNLQPNGALTLVVGQSGTGVGNNIAIYPTTNTMNWVLRGTDTNIGYTLQTKGTGNFYYVTGGGQQAVIADTQSAVNYLGITGSITGAAPSIYVAGSDANINLKLTPKGTGDVQITGTAYSPNFNLTDAATIAWDTATAGGQVATFTFVSSNRTMGAPTNLVNGAFYALAVIQNAGSNTLTWNSVFKWAAGTAPTLSTAAGAKDYFTFRSDGVSLFQQGISQAVA